MREQFKPPASMSIGKDRGYLLPTGGAGSLRPFFAFGGRDEGRVGAARVRDTLASRSQRISNVRPVAASVGSPAQQSSLLVTGECDTDRRFCQVFCSFGGLTRVIISTTLSLVHR